MAKVKLSKELEAIVKDALYAAYHGGNSDACFLANGRDGAVIGADKRVKAAFDKYFESEEVSMLPILTKERDDGRLIPEVMFNPNGKLSIQGQCRPENTVAFLFFNELIDWVNKYTKEPAAKTEVIIDLTFFNSGAGKGLRLLLEALKPIAGSTTITWYYGNRSDYMEETEDNIEEMQKILPYFSIIAKYKG